MSSFLNNPEGVVPISLFLDEIDQIVADEDSPAKSKFISLVTALGLANDAVDGPITGVSAHKISGGITNALYIVHLNFGSHQRTIVLRLFGFATEQFIDRKVENIVFSSLSKTGSGPTFYGLFITGRIEGFLQNVQSLEPLEMSHPKIFRPVAKALYSLHATSIPEVDMMQSDWLWGKLNLFFDLAMQKSFSGAKLDQYNALNLPLMRIELNWYREYITSLHSQLVDGDMGRSGGWHLGQRLALQRVLCHNDLLCGNIMRTSANLDSCDPEDIKITIIDFEYAGYNYRAYDMANHFCGKLPLFFCECSNLIASLFV
jgi:thiamine kinase-like enzyme